MSSILPMFEQRFNTSIGRWSPLKQLIVCIVPVSLLLAIPIVVALLRDGKNSDGTPRHLVAGTDEKRFFIWIEATWLGFWACKGVVSVCTAVGKAIDSRKRTDKPRYDGLLERLAVPFALLAWSVLSQLIFAACINAERSWTHTLRSCLKSIMVCSLIYFAKELVIQKIRLSFEKRILEKQSKTPDGVALLCKLMSSPSREEEGISRSSPAQESLQAEILSAFETKQQTTQFAEDLYGRLAPSKETASSLRFDEDIWARYGLSDSKPTTCDGFKKAILMIREESYRATDVMGAINDLNGLCWLVVLVLWAVTAVMFLTPSLLGAVATSATALLSLSFVVATTCQEVLGSCIFLFVKHPFDVGDHVKVDKSELLVEHIALLYTTFVRIDTGERTQLPNNMLNGHWVDNVTRSQVIREKLSIRVAVDTDDEQIVKLREKMEEEMREWKVTTTIEVVNIFDMQALELQCGVEYKLGSSLKETSSENARGQLRSQIMSAWIAVLRQVCIQAPVASPMSSSDDG
ncbi:hypothetical protein E8E11_005176 [Didymella keratinophila]|nr:hypothetical protein E8E11_005176 [Didymella keratinophila]